MRRRLEYDTWTTMLPNKSTHPEAETDLPLGRARIPANWSLQLVLFLATRVRVQHASSLRYLLTPSSVYLDPAEQVVLRADPKGRPWFGATTQEPEMGLRERVGLRGPCLETLHS